MSGFILAVFHVVSSMVVQTRFQARHAMFIVSRLIKQINRRRFVMLPQTFDGGKTLIINLRNYQLKFE